MLANYSSWCFESLECGKTVCLKEMVKEIIKMALVLFLDVFFFKNGFNQGLLEGWWIFGA